MRNKIFIYLLFHFLLDPEQKLQIRIQAKVTDPDPQHCILYIYINSTRQCYYLQNFAESTYTAWLSGAQCSLHTVLGAERAVQFLPLNR